MPTETAIKNIEHYGTIKKGKFIPENPTYYAIDLENYEGKRVALKIKDAKGGRSIKMVKYYWPVIVGTLNKYFRDEKVYPFDSREDTHERIKEEFLGTKKTSNLQGDERTVTKSTRDLSNQEFCDFLEEIWKFCIETFGFQIPPPDKEWLKYINSGMIAKEDVFALAIKEYIQLIRLTPVLFDKFIKGISDGSVNWDGEIFGPDNNLIEIEGKSGKQQFIKLSGPQLKSLKEIGIHG